MSKPLLLDTYCKAGGTSMGYHRAGFEVVGVDIEDQKRYPFEFHQNDAIEFIEKYGKDFDVIAGSPPCKKYGKNIKHLSSNNHPVLISKTRKAMAATGKPYIIENVPGAPLIDPIILCGTMFDLKVIRHRLFECSPYIVSPNFICNHNTGGMPRAGRGASSTGFISVCGNFSGVEVAKIAMDIDWMTRDELAQAIPPAYTEWLGKEMRRILEI